MSSRCQKIDMNDFTQQGIYFAKLMVRTSTFIRQEKQGRTVLVKLALVIQHIQYQGCVCIYHQIHEPDFSGYLKRVRPLLGTGPWAVAQHHCRADENPAHGQTPPSCSGAAPAGCAFRSQALGQSLGGWRLLSTPRLGPSLWLFLLSHFQGPLPLRGL